MKAFKSISLFIAALFTNTTIQANTPTDLITNETNTIKHNQNHKAATIDLKTKTLMPEFSLILPDPISTFERIRNYYINKNKKSEVFARRAGIEIQQVEDRTKYFLSNVEEAVYMRQYKENYGVSMDEFKQVQTTKHEPVFNINEIKHRKVKFF